MSDRRGTCCPGVFTSNLHDSRSGQITAQVSDESRASQRPLDKGSEADIRPARSKNGQHSGPLGYEIELEPVGLALDSTRGKPFVEQHVFYTCKPFRTTMQVHEGVLSGVLSPVKIVLQRRRDLLREVVVHKAKRGEVTAA